MERITRGRAIALIAVFLVLLCLYSGRMYALQMLDAGDVVSNSDTYTSYTTVKASRGDAGAYAFAVTKVDIIQFFHFNPPLRKNHRLHLR